MLGLADVQRGRKGDVALQNQSRPYWQRVVKSVTGAVAVLAWGALAGNERRVAPSRPVFPEVQRGQQREVLLQEGWGSPSPQRLIKPSYWPFVFGLGITFLLGGIATDFMVSGLGIFIFGLGMIGWIRDLLDEQDNG